MEKMEFLNRLLSLWNIDAYRLPELSEEDWLKFRDNPPQYFVRASDEQFDAIWREIEVRQTRRKVA
jgi:hypothetical protein